MKIHPKIIRFVHKYIGVSKYEEFVMCFLGTDINFIRGEAMQYYLEAKELKKQLREFDR